jgi:glycosyltransferase involved in cell wall biosynthesis
MMRVAIVVPRYGPEVLGGAESQARGFAEEAVGQDWDIEVWTTCAESHYTWENVYPKGRQIQEGVVIHRFPVTQSNSARHSELEVRLSRQGFMPRPDQYDWLMSGIHSVPLYQDLVHHINDFDVVIGLPYTAPLVHYAAWIAPEKVVIWPCLHDEPYAYMEPIRLLLENVFGVMFLSPEEGTLALERLGIYPLHFGVLGGGIKFVDPPRQVGPEGLLYLGRLEEGKNLSLLYRYVRRYYDQGGDIKLTVFGRGPLEPPRHPAFDYRGFVPEEDKALVCASSRVLCQPSVHESFSRTIMESWLASRPVLVHGECSVTKGHVRRSRGGLWFRSYEEFREAVKWFYDHPRLADRMGTNGRRYVKKNYAWQTVVSRFEGLVQRWLRTYA